MNLYMFLRPPLETCLYIEVLLLLKKSHHPNIFNDGLNSAVVFFLYLYCPCLQGNKPPDDGVMVFGLYMDGARWNLEDGCLHDSLQGQRFSKLPEIHFKPVQVNAFCSFTEDSCYCPTFSLLYPRYRSCSIMMAGKLAKNQAFLTMSPKKLESALTC